MRRVLFCWRTGTDPGVFQFLSRIDEKYKVPKDTKDVIFFEGNIANRDMYAPLDKLEIFISYKGKFVVENGKDLGQFIYKPLPDGKD